jgi:hypothetical protein
VQTGYGDVVGGILAIVAVIALARMATWSIAAVWIFNVWVTADVLLATVNGLRIGLDPGSLGPGFYILTGLNPPLFVTNVLIFILLLRARERADLRRRSGHFGVKFGIKNRREYRY